MSAPARGRPRLLFHVQHLLGVGHLNRAERIARACVDAGLAVEMTVNEGDAAPPGVEALPLPAIHAADPAFSALVDGAGRVVTDALWAERARRLARAVAARPPAVLLVEGYPFARRRLRGEIEPLVAAARDAGAAVACSLRDILVEKPDPARNSATVDRARALFDRILVHGDTAVAPLSASFPLAERLGDRLTTTGYVAPAEAWPARAGRVDPAAPVVVSVGGGAVGETLLEAAVEARAAGVAADRPWRLLGGPKLPPAARGRLLARIAVLEGAAITLEPALDGPAFRATLAGAALSISQAGYNTAVDLWLARPPAILIPFAGPTGKESEQPLRARRMAERGEATVVPERDLSAERLGRAIEAMLATPDPAAGRAPPPALDGAARSAEALAALAGLPPLR